MGNHYYQMPLNLGQVIAGNKAATCSLGESISQNLFLLICTRKGDMPGEPDFGSDIWDMQFELIIDQRRWKNAVESSLLNCIKRFETRLKNSKVDIKLEEVEVNYPFRKYPEVKHQATIKVEADLKHSGEPFRFATNIYVSPLAG